MCEACCVVGCDANVKRFRGGLVFKAHRLLVSLNSRLESDKEGEEEVTRVSPLPRAGRGAPADDRLRALHLTEREFSIFNLLVRIHFIVGMIWWSGLAPWEFEFPFPGSLISTCLGAGRGASVDDRLRALHLTPSFLNPQPEPSTFNLQPSTLSPQPSTLNPQHSTLNPQPSTLNPQHSTLNPQHSTLNP